MNKAILLSIKPQHVANILNGRKTIEIRKKFPKDFKGWVYIYCTKGGKYWRRNEIPYEDDILIENGKVVARFWCDNVEEINVLLDRMIGCYRFDTYNLDESKLLTLSCLEYEELVNYLLRGRNESGYAIHISQLEIFKEPKELREFKKYGMINFLFNHCGDNWVEDNWNELLYMSKPPQNYCYIEVEE